MKKKVMAYKYKHGLKSNQIKSFIILAGLRRSVLRVGGSHLRIIAEMGSANSLAGLTGPRFEPQTSRSRDKCV